MPSGGCYLAEYLRPGMRYFGVEQADGFFDNNGDTSDARLIAPIVDVPLPDNSVDYIVSLAALHHEPDLTAVFDEMRRLTRMGGRIVIADVEVDTPPARFLDGSWPATTRSVITDTFSRGAPPTCLREQFHRLTML